MNGSAQLPVDRWVQELNPDRYAGNDYVTSFTLQMTTAPDGTLTAIAPAPGRYKIAAWKGSSAYETYVLVRPQRPVPEIRGSSFNGLRGPLTDQQKQHASRVFALANRAGMNWASIVETGGMDLDAVSLTIEPYCSFCSDTVPLDDYGWLIDEAHRQGLKVALELNLWGKTTKNISILTGGYCAPNAAGEHICDLDVVLPAFPSLIPAAMQAYANFMSQMAGLAQAHNAEAMFVGNESNFANTPGNLLWSQKDQWKTMMSQVRSTFKGEVWIGGAGGGCGEPADLDIWQLGDSIHDANEIVPGVTNYCLGYFDPAASSLTAEQMSVNIARALNQNPFVDKLKAATGLPIIATDVYPVPADGSSNAGSNIFSQLDNTPRDNQEDVDYFEALMRTVGQQELRGFFPYAVALTSISGSVFDALRQPAMANAIANWWGGDNEYLSLCLIGQPRSGLLFREDFETGSCPLNKLDSFIWSGRWDVVQDSANPQNHVLHGTQSSSQPVPTVGRLTWRDYTVTAQLRLLGGTNPPTGGMSVRVGGGFSGGDNYGVHLGSGQLTLIKHLNTIGQQITLASYTVAGGTQLNRWYNLEVTAIGPTIFVKLDGNPAIQYTDQNNPLLAGGVEFSVGTATTQSIADFDNVVIAASGQSLPVINSGGVANAASPSLGLVAPGSIAAVFGSNLSSAFGSAGRPPQTTLAATTLPLPTWLGLAGASLWANTLLPVPIWSVSQNQINIQIPWELAGQSQATLKVIVDGVASGDQTFDLAPVAPGIFSMNGQGFGQGAILIANTDTIAAPSASIAGRNARPARRGDLLSIYCTGLGDVTKRSPSGADTSGGQPATTLLTPRVTIGSIPATIIYSGLAPGFPGLYQVNVQVPADAPVGDAVPVLISSGGANSNIATIAVQ